MTDVETAAALSAFKTRLAAAQTPDAPWSALQELTEKLVGVKLFTIMTVDMVAEVARRAYSSNPEAYPVSGTKPIHYDSWFETVHLQQRPFIANTIADISEVFGDHELIWSLGCGSVINLPVVVDGVLLGTVNMLHEEHFYTEARVEAAVSLLTEPSLAAFRAAA
ncbi:GAF domain-containing protein [Oryzibacter oryziterrae]|uniref:GAF domain-containing protein n=1 Tax=Oryzibacter oryziterrae TaxID=2766474 RepID=UPI001F1F0A03|nr:GAF domain-containing protein [Oryzibacter oryziterrae]